MQYEAKLLFVRQRLIAKHQHGTFGHSAMDCRDLVGREWLPAIGTHRFACEREGRLSDRYGHRHLARRASDRLAAPTGRTISTDPGEIDPYSAGR